MKEAAYKRYLLNVLLLILTFNYLDRSVLALALQTIKLDLHLSDTELGFLSGIAFALFYAVMGIPIARWADRGNRVTIIGITTALWSVMVALCGMAGNFLQLLLIRIGVAVGEAGCVPPAHSLIADYFTRAERPRAVAIYMLGSPVSVVVGYFLAGWLNEFYGWRATFIMMGLPGVGLATLAWLSLREPRLGKSARNTLKTTPASTSLAQPETETSWPVHATLREVRKSLWANRTYRHLLICFSVLSFFSQGIWQWQPAYFVRSYGLKTGELGTWFAVSVGLTGIVGMLVGGEMASRAAAHNERLQLKAMAVAFAGFGALSAGVYLSPNQYVAFGFVGLAAMGVTTAIGPLFGTLQTVVPQHMRAMSIAVIYLFANLIGMGLGPLAAGALSDALRPWVGDDSLREALLILCPGCFWAAWHGWQASKTVSWDLKAIQTHQQDAFRKDRLALNSSMQSPP